MKTPYRVLILPSASKDLSEAVEQLESYSTNSGMKLVERYDSILELLENNPNMYGQFEGEIRRATMKPMKYSIYYYVDEKAKDVNILAILSDRLNPSQIQRLLGI